MFDIGAISGRIVLDKSDWDSSISKVERDMTGLSSKMNNLSDSLRSSGSYLSSIGTRMIFLGGTMLAPFILSVKAAASENYAFQIRLNSLGDSFKKIEAELAAEMLPKLEMFTKEIEKIVQKFRDMDPQTKTNMANFVVFTATTLIAAGTITKLIGVIEILGSAFMKVGGFLLWIIPLFAVFKTFRLMGLATDIGVLAANAGILYPALMVVGAAFAGWKLAEVIGKVSGLNEALSGKNGLFTRMFMWLDEKGLSEKWDKFWSMFQKKTAGASGEASGPKIDLDRIVIFHTPSALDVFMRKMGEFNTGFTQGLKNAFAELANFGKMGEDIAKRTATAMGTAFSDLFFNVFTAQFNNIKQVFADFGNTILRMLADILARVVMYFAIIRPMTAAFPALKPVFGLADGTNSVPFTGIYKLHAGEEVKPVKYTKDGGEGQSITIQNNIVSESVAAAMATQEGQKVIVNTIRLDALRNGVTRRETIRR